MLPGGGAAAGAGGEAGAAFRLGAGGGPSLGMDHSGSCGAVGGRPWSAWRPSGRGGEGTQQGDCTLLSPPRSRPGLAYTALNWVGGRGVLGRAEA